MRTVKKGATSQSVYFDVLDSTSTTGGRKTGLAFNTSSLVAYYVRSQGTATAITLATLAAANTAWSSGGFKEVDATNMPGIYRLDVPDAAFATGAGDDLVVVIKGATGMVQASCDIQLVAYDPQDTVRAGLTALPNAAAEAAGGLYTRGTGAGQINQDGNGRIDTNVVNWKGSTAAAMTGDAYARLGAPAGASVSADVAAVKTDTAAVKTKTDFLPSATAGAAGGVFIAGTNAATTVTTSFTTTFTGNLTGSVGSVSGAVGSVTGNVGGNVVGSVGSVAAGGITSGSFAAGAIDSAAIAADAIGSSELAASAASEIGTAVWAVATRELTSGANIVLAKGTGVTGFDDLDAAGVRGAVGLASANLDTQIGTLATASSLATVAGYVDTEVAAIKAKTDNLPSDPADASDIAAAFTSLQSHGDSTWATATGFATAASLATTDGKIDTIKSTTDKIDDTLEDDAGTFRFTANALEQAPTGGTAPTADEIADEVQTRTIAAVTVVNGLAANSVTAAALAADAGTEIGTAVWATTTRVLTAGTNIALAKGTGVTGFNDLSAAQVNAEADAALADAGVTTTVTGRIDAAISTRLAAGSYTAPDNASVTAIKAKTDNLPSDPADQSLLVAATDAIIAGVDAVKAKTDSLTFTVAGSVDANISHVNEVEVIGTGSTGDEWAPAP